MTLTYMPEMYERGGIRAHCHKCSTDSLNAGLCNSGAGTYVTVRKSMFAALPTISALAQGVAHIHYKL